LLYETKIWRGKKYFEAGIDEIREYILGENSDGNLLGAFYVVFDPTKTHRAQKHLGAIKKFFYVAEFPVEVLVINILLDTPSSIGSAYR
jgi:hypothetical protein